MPRPDRARHLGTCGAGDLPVKGAVFLDRDGVINRKPAQGKYVTHWGEMEVLPGVPEAIALLTKAGFDVVVVSNQRCVAKGLLTAIELEAMHEKLCRELAAKGAFVLGVYYCPHDNQPPCSCRKPSPGMLLKAASEHQLDLEDSWMIGDSEIDIQAGRKAGCRTARISDCDSSGRGAADLLARDLLDATLQLLNL